MRTDVICIGQAVVDCITRGREAEVSGKRSYRAEEIRLSVGGDAVNESFRLAGKGYAVKLFCGIGKDHAGSLLLSEIKKRGIDVSRVTVSTHLATPVASLLVDPDGSRISYNSPAAMLEGYVPSADMVRDSRIVSLASLFRAPLDRPDVVKGLIRAAHASGSIICCDTKVPTFRDIRLSDLAEVLPMVDYMFPNETEAAFYTGKNDYREMAAAIRAMGVKNVVIKAGPEGCYADMEEGCFSLPAIPAEVVDTTGAGDAFAAGFISGLLEGISREDCLMAGLKEAAECVGQVGACASIPSE